MKTMTTLDGVERTLVLDNIVITNGTAPIALAGVMGGLDSEITDGTVTVALEAALFNPVLIRKTAGKFNLRSESSSRFEKGINVATIRTAGQHAAELMHVGWRHCRCRYSFRRYCGSEGYGSGHHFGKNQPFVRD